MGVLALALLLAAILSSVLGMAAPERTLKQGVWFALALLAGTGMFLAALFWAVDHAVR